MAIRVDQPPSVPNITYDRVFLVSLDIRQQHQDDDTVRPVYRVVIRYRLFGVDADGMRHYSGLGIQTMRFDDYLEMAVEHQAQGDPYCLHAFDDIQRGIAHLISKHRGAAATVI